MLFVVWLSVIFKLKCTSDAVLLTSPEVNCHCVAGHLKMAETLAARFSAQEEQIRLLSREISVLRDGLSTGVDAAALASGVSPELESLRTENEKLRYRLLHLRRGLRAEAEEVEEAQGNQRHVKCGKAAEKTSSGAQRTNKPAEKRVMIVTAHSVQV